MGSNLRRTGISIDMIDQLRLCAQLHRSSNLSIVLGKRLRNLDGSAGIWGRLTDGRPTHCDIDRWKWAAVVASRCLGFRERIVMGRPEPRYSMRVLLLAICGALGYEVP